jgi:tetratricopeptide (TPR) repeat protein
MSFIRSVFAQRAAVAILAALGAALPQIVAAQSDPLAGTWNFVPARSTATPGPVRYKSMTLTFSDTAQGQMTLEGVDAQDKPVKGTFMAIPDGKPHPVSGISDYDSGSWSKFNDATTTYSYTRRKTNIILGSRTLSPDGHILTFNEKAFDDKGKQLSISVMIFAKPGFEMASATPPPAAAQQAAPIVVQPRVPPDEIAGTAAMQKGDTDAAIAAFTRVIDSNDKDATLNYDHTARGVAYLKKNMTDQALADFDAAIMVKSDDADARWRRANIRVQRMQYAAAIEDLSVVVQVDAMNADAFRLRGFLNFQLSKNVEGAADNEKACSLNMALCMN